MAIEEGVETALPHEEGAAQSDAAHVDAEHAAEGGIHVAIAPEILGTFMGIPITNTLVTSYSAIFVILIVAILISRNLKMIPGRMQTLFEEGFSFFYDYVAETLESNDLARRFFPLLVTIFLFVFVANIMEFLPGVGSLEYNGVHLLRGVNTDLNTPLVLALISFFVIEITGIMAIGIAKYGSKFIVNPLRSPIGFAVGLVELIGELVRVVSLSFRLFGNILAGQVVIAVALYFSPYLLPVPLMMFEIFIGTLQAAVFSLLTLFFIKLAVTEPHGEEAH